MRLPRLRRRKPTIAPERLTPTHELEDGTRVRILGPAWRVETPNIFGPPGCVWVAALFPDFVVRPVNTESVALQLPKHWTQVVV